jgi:hypothetical protein
MPASKLLRYGMDLTTCGRESFCSESFEIYHKCQLFWRHLKYTDTLSSKLDKVPSRMACTVLLEWLSVYPCTIRTVLLLVLKSDTVRLDASSAKCTEESGCALWNTEAFCGVNWAPFQAEVCKWRLHKHKAYWSYHNLLKIVFSVSKYFKISEVQNKFSSLGNLFICLLNSLKSQL